MMVAVKAGIEPRGLAVRNNFADQTGASQRTQAVIHRGARSSRVAAIHGVKNIPGSGMRGMAHQELQHRVTLGGGPQRGGAKSLFEFQAQFRHVINPD